MGERTIRWSVKDGLLLYPGLLLIVLLYRAGFAEPGRFGISRPRPDAGTIRSSAFGKAFPCQAAGLNPVAYLKIHDTGTLTCNLRERDLL
jgi:hypothetical protein